MMQRISLELARKLYETKRIRRSSVSVKVKELLRDKISEGKIKRRWIDESLPSEYKRKYTKSEDSSLSENGEKEIIEDTALGQIIEIKYQEIKIAMNNNRNCFYLIFDVITGLLLRSGSGEQISKSRQ
jgi:hypothetical protein